MYLTVVFICTVEKKYLCFEACAVGDVIFGMFYKHLKKLCRDCFVVLY